MIIDGKQASAQLREKLAAEVTVLREKHQLTPGLAVVLVGEDPASQVYVRSKGKQTVEAGMNSFEHRLPADADQQTLMAKVHELNSDASVHGILVQLPLPDHLDESSVIEAISPAKDVDGFHVVNSGKLMSGLDGALVPCTPSGCIILLKQHLGESLSGKHAVVVGRSNIVGKPVAHLLLQENCTVTIAHSRTQDLAAICRQADILIAAVGRPEMLTADFIKPGATVIDVGINRIEKPEGGTRLVGDVYFEQASPIAGGITPVPGGVGPMTIACLLRNTILAACAQHGIEQPKI